MQEGNGLITIEYMQEAYKTVSYNPENVRKLYSSLLKIVNGRPKVDKKHEDDKDEI